MIVNIEGREGLVRDISSGAILNTNRSDYENYMIRKQQRQEQKATLDAQSAEINTLKAELEEIKSLLKTLIREQNG